ncbi:MAG: Lrp/AsnC family transcriptional regulator [Candidatus Thorarchaeota archaeon]
MSELLNEELNVRLLDLIVSGEGIDINISALSSLLGHHRNTISSRLENIFSKGLVDRPFQPAPYLFKVFPLLVIERANFPRNPRTNEWIELDPQIWAAFFVKEEEYNTLMIEIHEDLHSYQVWKNQAVEEHKISLPRGQEHIISDPIYLSSESIIKYNPSAPMQVFKENFEKGHHSHIKGMDLDEITVEILEALSQGKAIKTNPNELARKLGKHRRTIQRRIETFQEQGIVSEPVCRFPRVWVPPKYFLVISLLEIRKRRRRILSTLQNDPHISMMIEASKERYNLVTFSSFYRVENFLSWIENYDRRFTDSIGAVRNFYLSPEMTFSISQQYVTLAFLRRKLRKLHGESIMEGLETVR